MDCSKCKFEDCINDEMTLEELTSKDAMKEVSRQNRLHNEACKRYAEKNRDKLRNRSLAYYHDNKDKVIEQAKRWQKENPLRVNALKKERYHKDIEASRQKQRDYRDKVKKSLPHCDQCEECLLVRKDKGEGYRRLCVESLRLIEQKVSTSPHWCCKRKECKDVNRENK